MPNLDIDLTRVGVELVDLNHLCAANSHIFIRKRDKLFVTRSSHLEGWLSLVSCSLYHRYC